MGNNQKAASEFLEMKKISEWKSGSEMKYLADNAGGGGRSPSPVQLTMAQARAMGLNGSNGEPITPDELKKLNGLLRKHGITDKKSAAAFFANSQYETGNWTIDIENHGKGPGYGSLQLTGPEAKEDFYELEIKNGYVKSAPTELIEAAKRAKAKYDDNRTDANKEAWIKAENKINEQMKRDDLYWESGIYAWTGDKSKTKVGSINDYYNAGLAKNDDNMFYMSAIWIKGTSDTKTGNNLTKEEMESLRDNPYKAQVAVSGTVKDSSNKEYAATPNENILVIQDPATGRKSIFHMGNLTQRKDNYDKILGIL